MDLIFIRRKYRNIRRIIISSFIIMVFVYAFLLINHVYAVAKKQKIYEENYGKLYNILQEQEASQKNEEQNAQEEITAKTLTEQDIENIKHIYKSEEKRAFLTFDDGPSKAVTPLILDLLKQENIKASFFVLGSRVELYPELAKREYDEGHYIANHGYSHTYSQIYSSATSVLDEYNKTNEAVKNAIGNTYYNTNVFRFPGGSAGGKYNSIKAEAKTILEQHNIASVDWNALTGDAEGIKEEGLLNRLKETTNNKNSIVILMHDAADKAKTYNVLPQVIEYLRSQGYQFKTFYDLLEK